MSTNQTQIMVPGILVALKTRLRGGVEYERLSLEEDGEGRVSKWETTRRMDDPAERKTAQETLTKASGAVARLCVRTTFGLLCPLDREAELDAAVAEMRRTVTEWNRQANHTFISCSAIKGRIADNDEEAIQAILDEARDLLDQMDRGLSESDVKQIRDAANRARRLSEMMTDESAERINDALSAARTAARAIVKRGDDLGDRVANAIVEVERDAFSEARFSFLEAATLAEALPSVDLQRGASLEVVAAEEVA